MDRTDAHDPAEWESVMVDLSGMSLSELTALIRALPSPASPRHPASAAGASTGDSPLLRGLSRLADELAEPDEPIAGFNSAL